MTRMVISYSTALNVELGKVFRKNQLWKKMRPKSIILDVMLDKHFVCQVAYPLTGKQLIEHNGKILEVMDEAELRNIIETKRPSLKGKNYHVAFTNRKV